MGSLSTHVTPACANGLLLLSARASDPGTALPFERALYLAFGCDEGTKHYLVFFFFMQLWACIVCVVLSQRCS